MAALITAVTFFLILGVLVFVHELGHFAVAKWTGMRVDEFAIGFPPRLFSRRNGETVYALNAIPFGGYVKIHGENPEAGEGDPRSFDRRPVWARMLVITAGVAMNVLFAFTVLTAAYSIGFTSYAQDLTKIPGATVVRSDVIIADAVKDGPAAKAGIKAGDIALFLRAADGSERTQIRGTEQLLRAGKTLQELGKLDAVFTVSRDGTARDVPVRLNPEGYAIGVASAADGVVRLPVWRAPGAAIKEIGFIFGLTWDALKGFGSKLFLRAELDPTVSGPVGIYQATGAATRAGIIPTVFLAVALSLNLALLNILPIPALDGGKLFFLITELVAGRRVVRHKVESAVTFAGFIIVMGLIAVLSIRDVAALFR